MLDKWSFASRRNSRLVTGWTLTRLMLVTSALALPPGASMVRAFRADLFTTEDR